MLRFPIRSRTLAELKKLSGPSPVAGGSSEAIFWAFHDTATYVDTVTTQLAFFTAARANRQLTNLATPGSLPEPQYFEIYGFHVDILLPSQAATWADKSVLLFGSGAAGEGAPTFQFTYADKIYGPWALSLLHGTGGITGQSTIAAQEYAENAVPDGGLYQDGAIMLAPNQGFQGDIVWGAAQNIAANTDIRLTMSGVLHRRIV